MSAFDNLYKMLPVWAQNAAISTYGIYWHWLRFGAGFRDYVQDFQSRERFSLDEWQNWLRQQLIDVLSISVDHVPYYKEQYSIPQKEAAKTGDLSALPLLEKQIARDFPRSLVRSDLSPKEYGYHTSGTTGTPIVSIWTRAENRKLLALREARSANWAGVSFSMPRATFSGRMIVPDPQSSGPYYRYNAAEKQVYFSAFHLKPDTAKAYIAALWKHKTEWLTGYANSYYHLAQFMLDQGIKPPPLKAVITTSEKLTPEMRTVMETAYKCRVYEEYSIVENALFVSECEHGRMHVSPDAGIVEILRPDGKPCEPGEIGEVVCTCLARTYQPLIRYRLGDLASWSVEACPCGRNMPVIEEIIGRIEDVVIGSDGRQLMRFHGVFTDQPQVVEGQIIQEALDHVHVKIVPKPAFSHLDVANIVSRVQNRLGAATRVTVETVSEIPRSASGKFRAVICNIPPEEKERIRQSRQ